MSETQFSDTPQAEIVWRSLPGRRDCIRSSDWRLVIRRVYEDGCTLYQLWDTGAMTDRAADRRERERWRLVQWCADSESAKEAAGAYTIAPGRTESARG